MSIKSTLWSMQDQATAQRMAAEGATAAVIAATLGRTRNSVIGWLNRAGLGLLGKPKKDRPSRAKPAVERRAKPKAPPRPRYSVAFPYMTGANPMPPMRLPKREPLPPLGDLMTATATQCRWIDEAPAICGRDIKLGSSYCPHHHAIVYVKKGNTMTDDQKRAEIIAHINATYKPPEDGWLRAFFLSQVKRATPTELNSMLHIVRSKNDAQ